MMKSKKKSIWVFGDYRNYYQNRVTLQLLSKAVDIAQTIQAEVCALVFGHEIDEWIMEYTAHGADRILAIDDPALKSYSTERYLAIIEKLAKERDPEILLIGATDFGREFAPRLAKRLQTGLSADCVGLILRRRIIIADSSFFWRQHAGRNRYGTPSSPDGHCAAGNI